MLLPAQQQHTHTICATCSVRAAWFDLCKKIKHKNSLENGEIVHLLKTMVVEGAVFFTTEAANCFKFQSNSTFTFWISNFYFFFYKVACWLYSNFIVYALAIHRNGCLVGLLKSSSTTIEKPWNLTPPAWLCVWVLVCLVHELKAQHMNFMM